MQYVIKLFVFMCVFSVSQSAFAQAVLSLAEAWQQAEKHAPALAQQQLQQQAAQTQVQLAERLRLPTATGQYSNALNLGRSIDPFTNQFLTQRILGNNYGVSANYLLFNGGQVATQITRAQLLFRATNYQTLAQRNQVRLQTLVAYSEVLLANEQLRHITAQQAATAENITYFQKLYAADRLRLIALRRLEAEQARLEGQQLTAQLQRKQAQQTLGRLVGLSVGLLPTVQELATPAQLTPYSHSAEDVYIGAIRQLPELHALRLQRQARQQEEALATAKRLPEVTAVGNLGTTYSSAARRVENNELVKIAYPRQFLDNLNMAVGFTVRVPIFNTVNFRLQEQAAKIETHIADLQLTNKALEIRGLVEESYAIMQSTAEQYVAQNNRIVTLAQIVELATLGFREGRTELNDYLQSKQELEQALLQVARLKYEYVLRKKIIAFYHTGNWE